MFQQGSAGETDDARFVVQRTFIDTEYLTDGSPRLSTLRRCSSAPQLTVPPSIATACASHRASCKSEHVPEAHSWESDKIDAHTDDKECSLLALDRNDRFPRLTVYVVDDGDDEYSVPAPRYHKGDYIHEVRPGRSADEQSSPNEVQIAVDEHTSVMLRNLPAHLSRPALVQHLIACGYAGLFDFVYMPMNKHAGSFGYAFVNFHDHTTAMHVVNNIEHLDFGPGSVRWTTSWSECQGLAASIDRYRNSALMHPLMPDEKKPALYDRNGNQIAFPEPTGRIPKPRIRHAQRNVLAADRDQGRLVVLPGKQHCAKVEMRKVEMGSW